MRGALHAATALNRGLAHVVSADRGLDAFPGLRRLDPLETSAIEALAAG